MKFSIIIPCYNITDRLDKLSAMFKNGQYSDYEVIFVDDCSPDGGYELMQKAFTNEPKYSVIQTECNGGPGVARNVGLNIAQGDYIMFCDSDDEFDVNILTQLDEFICEHGDFDFIISPFNVSRGGKMSLTDIYTVDESLIIDRNVVAGDDSSPFAKVYKKNIIDEYTLTFPQRMTGEDKCFVVNYLVHCNKVYKFNRTYYTYVINKQSITHNFKPCDWREVTTFDILQPIYHEYFPDIEVDMFVKSHLLTRAKNMVQAKCSNKEIKEYFKTENERYPNWIDSVDMSKQSAYRKMIFKAMAKSNAFMIKAIMKLRQMLY